MQRPPFVILAGVLSASLSVVSAQEGPSPQGAPLFRSGVNLVALNVAVQNRQGGYVTGLQPSDFVVVEDGQRRDVRLFETTAVPIDLIVLLDTSRSMLDEFDLVRAAAHGFLDTLRPADRGAVIGFNQRVSVLQGLTGDRRALGAAVDGLRFGGDTAIRTALYISLKSFGQNARGDASVRRQAVAVLTDGEDNASAVSYHDVLLEARRAGVNIYPVLLQSRTSRAEQAISERPNRYLTEQDYEMAALARETGGRAYYPSPLTLGETYQSIAADLASQYAIGYEPVSADCDGQFHRVSVHVVNRPELRTRTRLGYLSLPAKRRPEP